MSALKSYLIDCSWTYLVTYCNYSTTLSYPRQNVFGTFPHTFNLVFSFFSKFICGWINLPKFNCLWEFRIEDIIDDNMMDLGLIHKAEPFCVFYPLPHQWLGPLEENFHYLVNFCCQCYRLSHHQVEKSLNVPTKVKIFKKIVHFFL